MRLLPCVLPACAIFCLGCSSQNEFDDLRSRIDKGFMATLPSDGSFSIRALKRLTGMVDTETDPVIREQGRRYLEKRILSFEVDKLSYQHQSNYQDILLKFGYHEGMGFRSASVQEGWEVRLRTLNRLRSELRQRTSKTWTSQLMWRIAVGGIATMARQGLMRGRCAGWKSPFCLRF